MNILKKLSFRNILLVFFYILIFVLFLKNSYSYLDPDLGWHLKFGQEILETRDVPRIEHVNFPLEGKSWVDHEWLINLVSYLIYSNLGYTYLNIFFALIATLTIVLFNKFLLNKYSFNTFQTIFLLLPELCGIYGILPHFGIRMQEITVLFFLLLLFIIFKFHKNKNHKYLFLMIPLVYIWSTMHAGFLISFFVMGLYVFSCVFEGFLRRFKFNFLEHFDLTKKDLGVFVMFSTFSFLVTLISPYSWKLYEFLWSYRDTYYMTHILEWLPFYYVSISVYQFCFIAFSMGFFLLWFLELRNRKKINVFLLFLYIVFCFLAIKSKRHFPLFFVVSIFMIAEYIYYELGDLKNSFKFKYSLILKIILILFLVYVSFRLIDKIKFYKDPFSVFSRYPIDSSECVKNNYLSTDKLFLEYSWGGYFIWKYPEVKMFLDGRLPQYPNNGVSMLEEYNNFFTKDKSKEMLEKYKINLVFMKSKDDMIKLNWLEKYLLGFDEKSLNANRANNLREYLNSSKEWKNVCSGSNFVFYRKVM